MTAKDRVRTMSDEWLETTWDAIQQGGLGDAEYINGLRVEEWIELVYSERSARIRIAQELKQQ